MYCNLLLYQYWNLVLYQDWSLVLYHDYYYVISRLNTCVVLGIDLCCINSNDSHRRYPMRWIFLAGYGLVLYQLMRLYYVMYY